MTSTLLDPDVFARLWDAYVHEARLFFLSHVALFVVWVIAMVQFVRWRANDATREEVSARADFVRGVVGLFLIVGIAGTFVGLFEFAVRTGLRPAPPGEHDRARDEKRAGGDGASHRDGSRISRRVLRLSCDARAPPGRRLRWRIQKTRHVDASTRRSLEGEMRLLVAHTSQIAAHVQPLGALGDTISRGIEPLILNIQETLSETKRALDEQGSRLQAGKTS
jgi:hypothetical protein